MNGEGEGVARFVFRNPSKSCEIPKFQLLGGGPGDGMDAVGKPSADRRSSALLRDPSESTEILGNHRFRVVGGGPRMKE